MQDLKLIVDSGLVVLIWMVQLLVYPSFLYYSKENLHTWHSTYTPRITVIVAPLMLIQLSLSLYGIYQEASLLTLCYGVLVFFSWLSTFILFIPLHEKIQNRKYSRDTLEKLVKWNWLRTALWTIILIVTIVAKV